MPVCHSTSMMEENTAVWGWLPAACIASNVASAWHHWAPCTRHITVTGGQGTRRAVCQQCCCRRRLVPFCCAWPARRRPSRLHHCSAAGSACCVMAGLWRAVLATLRQAAPRSWAAVTRNPGFPTRPERIPSRNLPQGRAHLLVCADEVGKGDRVGLAAVLAKGVEHGLRLGKLPAVRAGGDDAVEDAHLGRHALHRGAPVRRLAVCRRAHVLGVPGPAPASGHSRAPCSAQR